MSRRARYDYYDPPRTPGVLPGQLRRHLQSVCLIGGSLRCLERWRVELYAIREGWTQPGGVWDGLGERVSHAEFCEEEAECDSVHARRSEALARVGRALTIGARPRRG